MMDINLMHHHYSLVTKWQTGMDLVNQQNCFAFNLGYAGNIPLPTFALPVDVDQNLQKYELGNVSN